MRRALLTVLFSSLLLFAACPHPPGIITTRTVTIDGTIATAVRDGNELRIELHPEDRPEGRPLARERHDVDGETDPVRMFEQSVGVWLAWRMQADDEEMSVMNCMRKIDAACQRTLEEGYDCPREAARLCRRYLHTP